MSNSSDGVDQKVQFKTIGPGVRRAVDEEAGVVLYRLFSPQSVQYEQGGAAVPIDQTELGDSE